MKIINQNIIKNTLSFLSRKSLRLIIILILVCTASFALVQFSPIDPVRAYIGADAAKISGAQKEIIAKRWGLDRPGHERFFKWAGEIASGNFGTSMIFNGPVLDVIVKRFFTSLWLMLIAWSLSGLLGYALGIISGVYDKSILARAIDLYSYTLASAPVFWIGIIMLVFFSVILQWAPVGGAVSAGTVPGEAGIWDRIYHLILPSVTLSIVSTASITLHTKKKVIELMQSDFVLYARARGETTFGIINHHIIRNSLLPAVSLQFASINEIFGGSVLVEQVFGYPGLGKAAVDAGIRGDIPLLLGITIFSTIFVYSGNVIADYCYKIIDPKIGQKENTNEHI
jgi:peptide/nickel transport system permease protein